jgi:Flp pilus assembly pilin Flp
MSRRRRGGDRGASLVEYALLIALVAIAAFLALRYFGDARNNSLSRSGSAIMGLVPTPSLLVHPG